MLEPYAGKLARTVLRGVKGSNPFRLPDFKKIVLHNFFSYIDMRVALFKFFVDMKKRGREVSHLPRYGILGMLVDTCIIAIKSFIITCQYRHVRNEKYLASAKRHSPDLLS